MSDLRALVQPFVDDGTVPGAVAVVDRGGAVEVVAAGRQAVDGAPMQPDSIFRIASLTKPITAAAVHVLIDDGRLDLGDDVTRWLPELTAARVMRTPDGPVEDTVPVTSPITVAHLLNGTTGWGWPSDFSWPAVGALFAVQTDGRQVQLKPPPADWLAALAAVPMLYQPGERWLYDTSSDLQGILVARVSGRSLPDFVADRITGPLGMTDTAFTVPADKRDRFTTAYNVEDGRLVVDDEPDGQWSTMPAFAEGAGGLAGTAEDYLQFLRLLRDGGRDLLSAESVAAMTTNQLTAAQRVGTDLFLEGQSWGHGGSVDLDDRDPWTTPGRYGWVGGSGTTAHLIPSTGTIGILLTQRAATDPVAPQIMRDFWTYTVQ